MEEVSELDDLLERYNRLSVKDQILFDKSIHDPTLEDREWHALNRIPPVYFQRYNIIKSRCVCVKDGNIAYMSKKVSPFNKSDFVDALARLGPFKLSIMWDSSVNDEDPPMLMSTSLDLLICHDMFWMDFKKWIDSKP